MSQLITNKNKPFKLICGNAIQLSLPEIDNLKFVSDDAYIASVLQNGKVIPNSVGYVTINVFTGNRKCANLIFEVVPNDKKTVKLPVLFNRYNGVSRPYGALVLLNEKYTSNKKRIFIYKNVVESFYLMCDDAKKENVRIYATQGYRTFTEQQDLINYFVDKEGKTKAMKRCAPAGFSEHHSGLSFDLSGGTFEDDKFILNKQLVYDWIAENCYKYGFMIKNPPGKEHITGTIYEPWHIRYIGNKRMAESLHKKQITLDEYYDNKYKNVEIIDVNKICETK